MDHNTSMNEFKKVKIIIKKHTIVVADTGDVNLIKKLKPQDATTNPSLLVKSTEQREYAHFLDEAIQVKCRII